MRSLNVVLQTPAGDRLAVYGEVAMISYVAPALDDALAIFLPIFEAAPRKSGAVLMLVDSACKPSSQENRERLRKLFETRGSLVTASAMVLLGNGFNVATHIMGRARLHQVQRPTYPSGIFSDVPSAASFIVGYMSGYTTGEIEEAAERLRDVAPR